MNRKSIWAVVAGVLLVVVTSTAIDQLLHMTAVYPPWGQRMSEPLYLVALSYRIAISVAAGWMTARLAPSNPVKHALWLGCIGTLLGLAGLASTWNMDIGPRWYPVSLMVLALPQSLLGARLYRPAMRTVQLRA